MRLEIRRGELTIVLSRRDLLVLLAQVQMPSQGGALLSSEIWIDERPSPGGFLARAEPDDLHYLACPTTPKGQP